MKLLAPILAACLAAAAQGQHGYTNCITVDPTTGKADYTTIQAAINSLSSPTDRTTILIYPATYTEEVVLGATSGNIDLVGVDRDSVVIVAPANKDAVTIKGTGVRNNSVQNLTIRTDDDDEEEGRGIVLKIDGTGADPSDVQIVGVRIETAGDSSPAIEVINAFTDIEVRDVFLRTTGVNSASIEGRQAAGVRVINCDFSCDDGRLYAGDDFLVSGCVLETRQSAGGTPANDDTAPIELWGHDNLVVDNCTLRGRGYGITVQYENAVPDNVLVSNCDIEGAHSGAFIRCGTNIAFQGCRLAANSDLGKQRVGSTPEYVGVRVKANASCTALASITFSQCVINAYSDEEDRDAIGVLVEDAPSDGPVRFLDCTISAEVTSDGDRALGVVAGELDTTTGEPDSIMLIGGSVDAIDADERQTALYDLWNPADDDAVWIAATGTKFSRWKGAIGAAVGQEATVMRVAGLQSAGAATVLAATGLTGVEQTIVNDISPIDNYRVLSVTGNHSEMNQAVIIMGLDWALRPIADSIVLSGTSTVAGVKAFRRVTKIILKAGDSGQTVSVGTTNILGLHAPVSATGDLLQIGRKTSAGTSYTIFASIPSPSVERGTVDISTLSPNNNDAFEFTYRASR
ncbi:MAG: right-handed parallel beta-helix repeat-containing protein [Phycisphaerales bacterium]|nr:right-handed parallel beta-helix repeat-containing protein [Phycisphaerales bacterium]